MIGVLQKVLGTVGDRRLAKYRPLIHRINHLYEGYQKYFLEKDFSEKTGILKEQIANGYPLDKQLPEAFAIVKVAFYRIFGFEIHDVQLMGAIVLYEGCMAEMKTGEGKTAVAVFAAYLNALSGEGVHIVTVNPYLAERDSEEMGKVFQLLGMTVGCIKSNMSVQQRQAEYSCDITYSTHYELGFDYLRDNMVYQVGNRVHRKLSCVIIDEVDSILIDEARTPLLISAEPGKGTDYLYFIDNKVKSLTSEDYQIAESTKQIMLTEEGIDSCERIFGVHNLMHIDHASLYHKLLQALRANHIMHKDIDYVIETNEQGVREIVIVDQNTGRLMFGRRFVEGLHQAIEAKEGIGVQGQPATQATITLQNYFRMYGKIAGMTGTGLEVRDEFRKIYGADVIAIPTHKPVSRIDHPDLLCITEEEKFKRVVQEIKHKFVRGQPVLVGSSNIKKSELLSRMLTAEGIAHKVLNAKNYREEAEVIRLAGQKGAVTISTNMAGRGVDILLGPGVAELGGLHIIGTTRHESLRIDNQLRGRSGRQGDVGSSHFIVSLEDELLANSYPDHLLDELVDLDLANDAALDQPRYIRGIRSAQSSVEGEMYSHREKLLMYDQILNIQRNIIYSMRNDALEGKDVSDEIHGMIRKAVKNEVVRCCPGELQEDWNLVGLVVSLGRIFPYKQSLQLVGLQDITPTSILDMIQEQLLAYYEEKKGLYQGDVLELICRSLIISIDKHWLIYMEALEEVKEGMSFRVYANVDPFIEYERETARMFDELLASIEQEALRVIWNQLE
ncbi:preprotein translocase subunit SecA [Paenibacillus eucommiae]|uniref:Protein translocase subunit SecA n=1 Tax=Paenibacillus eucommiae TaxID=1355755 RepID=A0ABS4IWP5_9BACL|nr:DEAD/DEAH box helicase [Paenibacillus eucommiae]MBP1991933.1 preprotein translocase subunit SecA [Paenibacillus eucommiae]